MKIMKKTSKKLTIAMVSDAIYPYNKGGKEKRIYEISTRLAKSGYDVHIYCMKWWKGKSNHRVENGVHLHAISKVYPLYAGQRRSIRQALFFAVACFKLIKEDFDVIDVDHMPHLILFPLKLVTILKRKKLYVTWNEVWGRKYWVEYMGVSGNFAYVVEYISSRLPDEIIAVSKHTKEKLQKELHVQCPITVIPNGINFNEIQKVKPAIQKSDVIFAGRLLDHKNVDFLIRSISLLKKKHPHITCIIIGKGPEENALKKLVTQLHLQENVIFYDFLEQHKDLYALMKSSKVFAFPSTREGFGIVVLEANACGIPVITINHKDNAARKLIKKNNGSISNLNEKAIAMKINNTLSRVNTLKKHSIDTASKYDWNVFIPYVERTYAK